MADNFNTHAQLFFSHHGCIPALHCYKFVFALVVQCYTIEIRPSQTELSVFMRAAIYPVEFMVKQGSVDFGDVYGMQSNVCMMHQ